MTSTSTTADNRVTFRAPKDLLAWLDERAARVMQAQSRHARAERELGLWREHLAAELGRQRWTLGELGVIAAVCSGVIADDTVSMGGVTLLAAEVIDELRAVPGVYGDQWEIDEDRLINKMVGLGPTGAHALRDAVCKWWDRSDRDHSAAGWAEVGVVVRDGVN